MKRTRKERQEVRAFLHRMASALGVEVVYRRASRAPPAGHPHPNMDVPLWYCPTKRRVYYHGPLQESAHMIPHEIVHCVWGVHSYTGPWDEWDSGMILYELDWVESLDCPKDLRRLIDHYGEEGRKNTREDYEWARDEHMKKHNLPVPPSLEW